METPDGKRFGKSGGKKSRRFLRLSEVGGAAANGAAIGLAALYRLIGQFLLAVLQAIWKFVITTWRLASALDSALWRAVKLLAGRAWEGIVYGAGLAGQVLHSLILWLPTRTGRAYSAVSGVALIVALLWIVDELRAGPGAIAGASSGDRPPVDEEDPILARIDARYVHLSEIEAAARASGALREDAVLTPASAFQRGLVESYVEQRLLARAAQDNGVHRAPSVLRRVNAARDQILAASLINTRLADEVTPEKIQQYYNEQRKIMQIGDEVRARHILVETGEEAEEIVALLNAGEDFAKLARERSLDRATAPLGGQIGWFSRAMLERRIANAAFSTEPGNIAAPFQTEFGWHVLEVLGRRPSSAKPFSAVEDDIENFLRLELIGKLLDDLEDENRVVYYRPETERAPTSAAPELPSGDLSEASPANTAAGPE